MSISRFNAVEKASNRKAVEAVTPEHKVSEYYGENVSRSDAKISLQGNVQSLDPRH